MSTIFKILINLNFNIFQVYPLKCRPEVLEERWHPCHLVLEGVQSRKAPLARNVNAGVGAQRLSLCDATH